MTGPYAQAAETYWSLGFRGALPLPTAKKKPPPTGWTGHGAPYPSFADITAWLEDKPDGNIALRVPAGILGLDVDAYDHKTGDRSLAALEAEHGPLPPTWKSTSRDDGVSGIMLYRVPAGINWRGGGTGDLANIELINAGHRFMVVSPSIHDKTGQKYRWVTPDGDIVDYPPRPDELPELPLPWIVVLALPYARAEAAELNNSEATEWLKQVRGGDMCPPIALTLEEALGKLQRSDGGARHEIGRDSSRALAAFGGEGHAGAEDALARLGHAFVDAATNPGRGSSTRTQDEATSEYRDLLLGAIRLAAAGNATPVSECDCETDDDLRDLVGDQQAPPGGSTDQAARRLELDVTITANAADWLRDNLGRGGLAGMFRRDGDLVYTPRVGEDGYVSPANADSDGPAQIRIVTAAGLAAQVFYRHRCVRIKSTKAGNEIAVPALFPMSAAQAAVSGLDQMSALRVLRGVTHTPILRADGSVLDQPGYDPASQLLYLPEPGLEAPPVPEQPSELDVKRAVKLIDTMVADFQFVTPGDKANYYGMLITPLLRLLAQPPYKLAAITAPQPGSGKTLLASVLRIIHGGVFRSEVPEDSAELRKVITAILDTTTGAVVCMDNLSGTLRSSVLAGLLTSSQWDDRRLGTGDTISRANDRLWVVTGNNIRVGGDLPRRTLWCTIDPGVPNPEQRTGFAIDDLESWTREHRSAILHALLVIARAWVVAGQQTRARGGDGYSKWIATVDGMLRHAGIPGSFDSEEAVRQPVGSDDDEWREFLEAVHGVFGGRPWLAKDLIARIDASDPSLSVAGWADTHPIPIDALPAALADKIGKPSASRTLAMWLTNREGRWAGNYTVRNAGKNRDSTILWCVEVSQRSATGSNGGAA